MQEALELQEAALMYELPQLFDTNLHRGWLRAQRGATILQALHLEECLHPPQSLFSPIPNSSVAWDGGMICPRK